MNAETFSDLIASLHHQGLEQTLQEFPEAAGVADALAELNLLNGEVEVIEQLGIRAMQRVEVVAEAIRQQLGAVE